MEQASLLPLSLLSLLRPHTSRARKIMKSIDPDFPCDFLRQHAFISDFCTIELAMVATGCF
jgi:hypothetical protein